MRITNFNQKKLGYILVLINSLYCTSSLVFIPTHFSKKGSFLRNSLFLVIDVKVAILDIGGAASYNI